MDQQLEQRGYLRFPLALENNLVLIFYLVIEVELSPLSLHWECDDIGSIFVVQGQVDILSSVSTILVELQQGSNGNAVHHLNFS